MQSIVKLYIYICLVYCLLNICFVCIHQVAALLHILQ